MSILVVGSVNMDVVSYVDKHAVPGETVQALRTEHHAGGKGANQAIAALRSGAEVTMVGAVGDDAIGKSLLQGLAGSGLSCSCISRKAGSSGMAFITVDRFGENQIVLSAGANAKLSTQYLEVMFADTAAVCKIRMMVLQNEIPWELNAYLLQLAGRFGIKTLFNPAPAVNITPEMLSSFHTVILNETEMAAITGRHIGRETAAETDAEEAVKAIAASGVEEVVLTLGSAGALYANRQGRIIRIAAFPVSVADTTAAGDTFIGAFAAASCTGMEAEERLRFAAAAAALAVSRAGAQSSIPQRDDTLELLRTLAK
ncbi:ribokinase [Paenibacillus thalictri]|uniref:Ribokinase n=1 Tax=Paenibacillus thalictri TaxID=2527873 RepID=A0A4V2J4M2_9BACL|nr:ribokinase [Paenibacillus thalictri]TBL80421.1 ribokinase [Paenibacillus thalictri]